MLRELIKKNRSYRRFYEDHTVDRDTLKELIDLARLSASAANRQPLKYIPITDPDLRETVFDNLSWAGYLKDWPGPEPGERPAAYIIILHDTDISENCWCDPGIAAQSMLLGATEEGLGGCLFGAVSRKELRKALDIEDKYDILYVLALGKPQEEVKLETVGDDGDIKYWRDEEGVHHVPKRPLEEIIIDVEKE